MMKIISGILNIIMGVVFILGGLSGTMVHRGTGSPLVLVFVGVAVVIWGIVRIMTAPIITRKESKSGDGRAEPSAIHVRKGPVVRPWVIALVAVIVVGFGAPILLKNFQMPDVNPTKMVINYQAEQAYATSMRDLAKAIIENDVDSAEAFESARKTFVNQKGNIPGMAKALEKQLKVAPSLVVAEGSGEEAIRITNLDTRKSLSVSFAPDGEVLCKNGNSRAEKAQKRRQAKKQADAEALIAKEEKNLQQERETEMAKQKEREDQVNAAKLSQLIQDSGLTGSRTIDMAQKVFNDKSWKQLSDVLAKALPDDYSVQSEDGDAGAGKVLVTRSGALEHLTVEINCNNDEFSAKVLEAPLDIGPQS